MRPIVPARMLGAAAPIGHVSTELVGATVGAVAGAAVGYFFGPSTNRALTVLGSAATASGLGALVGRLITAQAAAASTTLPTTTPTTPTTPAVPPPWDPSKATTVPITGSFPISVVAAHYPNGITLQAPAGGTIVSVQTPLLPTSGIPNTFPVNAPTTSMPPGVLRAGIYKIVWKPANGGPITVTMTVT